MEQRGAWTAPDVVDDQARAATEQAARMLGWPGVVLPEVTVFGCRFFPVVALDPAVHRSRQRDGDGPQRDSDVLAMWEWPEALGLAPAVRLSGALFCMRRRFSPALRQAREWRPFGPSAVLVPASALAEEVNRWECALHGVGLVAMSIDESVPDGDAGVEYVPAEAGRRAPARRRTADRWIEETLYALALDAGAFTANPPQTPPDA